jgi:ATP phosphoribosyltransferase
MLTLHCPPRAVHGLADLLRRRGATAVSVSELSYVLTTDNPLYAKLEAALAG